MRLKYLTVSYDLPKNQFYNKLFDNVRFFVTGTNLFVLSSFNKIIMILKLVMVMHSQYCRSVNLGVDVKF